MTKTETICDRCKKVVRGRVRKIEFHGWLIYTPEFCKECFKDILEYAHVEVLHRYED